MSTYTPAASSTVNEGRLTPPPRKSLGEAALPAVSLGMLIGGGLMLLFGAKDPVPVETVAEDGSATTEMKRPDSAKWVMTFGGVLLGLGAVLMLVSMILSYQFQGDYERWLYSIPAVDRQAVMAQAGQMAIGQGLGQIGTGLGTGLFGGMSMLGGAQVLKR